MAICKSSSSSWTPLFYLLFLALFATQTIATTENNRELVFLNWADYMDPELISAFEEKFNAKVLSPYFESDDHRTELLVESGAGTYDLMVVDTPSIDTYKKAGWLEQLDHNKIPNLKHIDKKWWNNVRYSEIYAAPMLWGTLGIAYRSDLVTTPPVRWMDLFRPDESLQGKIAMYRNTIDMVGAALKALGLSLNSTDPDELKKAGQLILDQRPYVRSYDYLNLSKDSALITGEVIATMFYNSDTLMLQELDENIKYVLPEEGGALWVDQIVVLKQSKNKTLAMQFINFINEPENAAQFAEYVYTATTNSSAEKFLPQEFIQDPVIYPNSQTLAKSEMNKPLPASIIRQRNNIITQLPRK